jgi:hypothetical protein
MLGGRATVKVNPLLALPTADVTTTGPAPTGTPVGTTHATAVLESQLQFEAETPLSVTVPGVVPKFVPEIVTVTPAAPDTGDRLVIFGTITVNAFPLLSTPLA